MVKILINERMFVVAILIILSGFTLRAQHKNYRPVTDMVQFKKDFAIESAKVNFIYSDFRQEKQLLALTEKIASTGKFWFKRSNKVRIDYEKPFVYRMIMNGDRILIRDDQKESSVNMKSNKLFQQVNRIMIDCIQGTIMENRDFTTKVQENESTFLLEMTPNQKSLKEFFSTIVLVVEKRDYSASSIEMKEPSGDNTIITFTNKVINQPIHDEVFRN